MDRIREARFVISPFLLFISMLAGAFWDDTLSLNDFDLVESQTLVVVTAIVAAATLPAGFLIGGLSLGLLRIIGRPARSRLEAWPCEPELSVMAARLKVELRNDDDRARAITVYAEEILAPGMRDWLNRMWNGFHTYTNCIVSLFLAPWIGWFIFSIHLTCTWAITSAALIAFCIWMARLAWLECRHMLEYQMRRPLPEKRANQ